MTPLLKIAKPVEEGGSNGTLVFRIVKMKKKQTKKPEAELRHSDILFV